MDVTTGEILAEAGTEVTKELADQIQNAAVPSVMIQTEERNIKVLSNMMVDLRAYVDCNPRDLGITELVYYPVLAQLMEENEDEEELKEAIRRSVHDLIPKHITEDDIFASINYNIHLEYVWATMTTSITWATAGSAQWASCCRISTGSVCPDWNVWFVSV